MEDAGITGAVTMVDADTATAGTDAGGEIVVIPYLVAGLGGLYSVGKAVDNIRFWNDYYKNTGKRPKYPFRSGSMDWMGYSTGSGYAFSRLKRL